LPIGGWGLDVYVNSMDLILSDILRKNVTVATIFCNTFPPHFFKLKPFTLWRKSYEMDCIVICCSSYRQR
jgi:hypothetical protein